MVGFFLFQTQANKGLQPAPNRRVLVIFGHFSGKTP